MLIGRFGDLEIENGSNWVNWVKLGQIVHWSLFSYELKV